ncbi:DUF3775 domain-containing protein [Algicella marina]|uniref:DUF3775 domain-containing protein n=1 Tax=Algicella marina TaxID=2683284 RepID=A0A6P1SXG3_9RHOB|nr:DUF3775 domain-containing protein [Algicella marina]QHQ34235.1 DUF3775 domain-containing protein [Algicella marina]
MPELDFDPEYLRRLIVKMRVVTGGEATQMAETLEEAAGDVWHLNVNRKNGDPLNQELEEEIGALDLDHKLELVALMWLGRGDFGADEWDEALALADERRGAPTAQYLLAHPQVADEIASGLDALGFSHIMEDGEY